MIFTVTIKKGTSYPDDILTATIDTSTRRTTALAIDDPQLSNLFIALNALLGQIEAQLALGTITLPPAQP